MMYGTWQRWSQRHEYQQVRPRVIMCVRCGDQRAAWPGRLIELNGCLPAR